MDEQTLKKMLESFKEKPIAKETLVSMHKMANIEADAIIKDLKKDKYIFGNIVGGKTLYALTSKGIARINENAGFKAWPGNPSRQIQTALKDKTICMGCEQIISLKDAKTKWDERSKTMMALCSDCFERMGFPE